MSGLGHSSVGRFAFACGAVVSAQSAIFNTWQPELLSGWLQSHIWAILDCARNLRIMHGIGEY
eukprot:2604119-Alexandrium_andersonii.AAC.1